MHKSLYAGRIPGCFFYHKNIHTASTTYPHVQSPINSALYKVFHKLSTLSTFLYPQISQLYFVIPKAILKNLVLCYTDRYDSQADMLIQAAPYSFVQTLINMLFRNESTINMAQLTLTSTYTPNETTIPNIFLDRYMPLANGEFVKVYLCLLRMYANPAGRASTLTEIADLLNHTESDVIRAIKYWERAGLLSVGYSGDIPVSITLLPISRNQNEAPAGSSSFARSEALSDTINTDSAGEAAAADEGSNALGEKTSVHAPDESLPGKYNYSPAAIKRMCDSDDNLHQLIFVAERLFGKTLTNSEISTIIYIHSDLHFSDELLEYLFEYCVSLEKRSFRYLERVAISWHEEGLVTAEQAKQQHEIHSKKIYSVMKAFGINDRMPGKPELDFITHWYDDYGFETDIVIEACNRTIQALHKPSFEYTDTILSNWRKKNVHTISDIESADAAHAGSKKDTYKNDKTAAAASPVRTGKNTNRFNNFSQRTYDFDALEKQLINKKD